jgi:hypothetical protein
MNTIFSGWIVLTGPKRRRYTLKHADHMAAAMAPTTPHSDPRHSALIRGL